MLVAYTSDGLSLMATKIVTPMMLDSYTNSMCLETWGSSHARILIEINAFNEFSDHLVIVVPNLKEMAIRKKLFILNTSGNLLVVVHQKDKGKGQTSGADDEGFIEVKKKKSGGSLYGVDVLHRFKFPLLDFQGNGVDVVVPVESIRAISERFANTAYGFFLEKREAYPVVANYVKNTWGKYGLIKSMLNLSTGIFSFQFSSIEGLDAMLENDPWFIRKNPLILKKWNLDVNLLKEDVGNVPVWVKLHGVPVITFSEDGLSVIATKIGTPLMLDSYTFDMCIQSWGRSSYTRVLIEVRADVELKDNIVVAIPKLVGEGFYTCNVRVEYEWKPPRCTGCKVFGHVQDECPKNKVSDVVKNMKKLSQPHRGVSVGPKVGFQPTKQGYLDVVKNMKKPNQTPRGVPVTPKVGFKPAKQVYRQVSKKNNVSTSGNKKKDVEPTKEANSSGSSFWNAESSSTSTTPIIEKIDKMERLIIDGTATLVDDEGILLTRVDSSGDHDSDDEVTSIDNDMAECLASKDVGYGNNSLLDQWKESYADEDYDYDPYDDDMYEGQDIPDKIQDICDNLNIKVRGYKKK
ncbi:putative reverse transcriptase domain-containing protein [Tanacetum coccineum]